VRYQQEIADTLHGFYSRCWSRKVTLPFWWLGDSSIWASYL